MSIPVPPAHPDELEDFPALTWKAHQPLARIHRQEFVSVFFGADQDERWNPPEPDSDWGTCYLTHPSVVGRFGLTAEASTGAEDSAYPRTQQ
jgi:hypothetical protein